MTETKVLSVEPSLIYFKRGDDFAHYLEVSGGNVVAALKLHAAYLRADSETLLKLAERLAGVEVSASAQTHMILLEMPSMVGEELRESGLVYMSDHGDEDCEDI